MGTGRKQVVMNTRERALSTDVNRLQTLASTAHAEIVRRLYLAEAYDDVEAGAVDRYDPSIEPTKCAIFGGLLVRPQNGTLNLLVDAGGGAVLLPPGSAVGRDESTARFFDDPGVVTAGALVVTAGDAASIRIDVVEMQWSDGTLEQDSRDQFDPATGLYTPATVAKLTGAELNYRVRAGSPGAGFPGTVAGWVPLAVVHVPANAATCDAMTFWDVRPLLEDVAYPGGVNLSPHVDRAVIDGTDPTATSGAWESIVKGRRVGGGYMRSGGPGTDSSNAIDLTASANKTAGASQTGHWHVYACTPYGLPRWAKYTDASGGARVPKSPRGLLLASDVAPAANGQASAQLSPPTSWGFSTQFGQTECVAIASAYKTGGFQVDGRNTRIDKTSSVSNFRSSEGSSTAGSIVFRLIAGTHFPANAKRIVGYLNATLTTAVTGQHTLSKLAVVQEWDGVNDYAYGLGDGDGAGVDYPYAYQTGAGGLVAMMRFDIPVPRANALGAIPDLRVTWSIAATNRTGSGGAPTLAANTDAYAVVDGWTTAP